MGRYPMAPIPEEGLYPVADTAALVMLWAWDYYQTVPLIRTYLEKLDLSGGKSLVDRYNEICPWYSEVIINRKHFIRNSVEEIVMGDQGDTMIINLGAGFSPLGLELIPVIGEKIRFLEVDLKNMEEKHRIYADLVPDSSRYITCVTGDIADTGSLLDILQKSGCDPGRTRIVVVMEGLSYYIERLAMTRLLGALSRFFPKITFVFEHLKPCRLISEERRFIPYRIFSHVRDYTHCVMMTTYSEAEIVGVLSRDFSIRYFNMDLMEKKRTGTQKYFPAPESGWLSCALATRGGI